MQIEYHETQLPVLRERDVAIVGGSLAGVAAALRLARDGQSVLLLEPRSYLGRDITATLRPWLLLPERVSTESLPRPIRILLDAHHIKPHELVGEVPLHPDTIKLSLEDALLEADVDLLYACLPVGVHREASGHNTLIIGNKSGRQAIQCGTIIDATETALVARLAGGRFQHTVNESARFSRTLEFDRAEPLDAATLPVPDRLGISGNVVRLHQGYRGPSHILAECDLDIPYDEGLEGSACVESEARRRTMHLAVHLIGQHPELARARYAGSSHELHGRWTSSLADSPPYWSKRAADTVVHVPGSNDDTLEASLSSFAGPTPDLWCLSEASRLDTEQAAWYLDPLGASRLGESIATSLLAAGRTRVTSRWPPGETHDNSQIALHPETIPVEIREPESPQRGRSYERRTVPPATVPIHRTVDVLVVGGGSSGATAAITAAREGMHTTLLDMNPGPGGTGTYGGVDSYWYGRHVGFAAEHEQEINAWHVCLHHSGGKWNIDAKSHVLREAANDAGVESLFGVVAIGAMAEDERVRGVVVASRWGPFAMLGEAIIDATGDGDIAAFAGAEFTYGAERTHSVMWYSLAQYASPGLIRNNFTSTVDVSNIEDYTRAILAGRRRGDGTHDHGIYVATRESRHVRGGVVMSLTDQLRHRQWPDVINIHYSNHDIKGQTESEWLRSGLIPPNLEVEIPYRLVVPKGLDGMLVAGKAISVTHDGLPAVRMQADLENLGGVVALAAAQAVREGISPRHIDLRGLQQRLVDDGLLPDSVLTRTVQEREYTDDELDALVEALTGEQPLYSYSDMHMGELFEELIPFVEICSAGDRAVPHLEWAHDQAVGARRLLLAQALAICGSRAGVPTLIEAIDSVVAENGLPARDSNIRHAGFAPDQGAMPDLAYLLYSLGMVPDQRALPVWTRVCELLTPGKEDFRDRFTGTYYYIDTVCHAAERSGDPAMIPLLSRLRSHAPLHEQFCRDGIQPDFFQERQAMLELGIARGLARCRSPEGYDVLIAYLDDVRALLAERAHSELLDLAGVDFGKNGTAWRSWLSTMVRTSAAP